jgi:hypothetical protein
MQQPDSAYRQLHLRVARWERGAKYTRATVRTPAALSVVEDGYLMLGTMGVDGVVATVARAPISELRMTRQKLPTPGASIVVDFGDSQWLIDFFWPQVVAASTNGAGHLVHWRVRWNCNRPIKTTRGAHRLRQGFIDSMVTRGGKLLA